MAFVGIWFARKQSATALDQMTSGVAVLTQTVDLEWAPGSELHSAGSALSPGWLRIKAGLAQIEFSDGARLLVEDHRISSGGGAERCGADFSLRTGFSRSFWSDKAWLG